jgi:serine-type D-Ala-D-Ala carboxypeptidase/endopeptidase
VKTACILALLSLPLQLGSAFAQAPSGSTMPSDAEIRKILARRIDVEKQDVGIVVGIVSPDGRRIIAYGSVAKGDPRPLNGDTVFEIGSMTKVFTSLVLMDMVQHGEVSLDDPVAKYLPATVHVPERAGRKITLRDLSTQTSGLPRMPSNFHPKDPGNPYADYTVEQLYEFLSGYTLTRDIGEKYEYSNIGVGLLGNALARQAGTNYETMVETRVLRPLGMKDTSITLSPEMKARLATGHNQSLSPVRNWDLPALAGAGALRSTADDMLTFLAANLGFIKTALAPAMAAEVSVRRPTGMPNLEIAYAWHVFTQDGKVIYWHNGATAGYHCFMGYDPETRTGVVVLSNVGALVGVDDIGHHLLDPAYPLTKFTPPKEHKEITLDSKILDSFTGSYPIVPTFVLTISRLGDHLYAQATGQGKFEIFPEGPRDFFAKVAGVTITFESDAQGNVTGLVVHQMGRDTPAKRDSLK